MTLRRHPDVAWQRIGEEAVLMSLADGRALGLNATGALVWALVEERDEEGLVAAVLDRFAIDQPDARAEVLADVRAFLALLRDRGLLSEA